MANTDRNKRRLRYGGFTLVELSVVLVVIGLVVGGVMVGKDLIRASENRGFVSQLEKFSTAANTFKLKYGCLPGDCAFGTSLGFSVTANVNGNGNGLVAGLQENYIAPLADTAPIASGGNASNYMNLWSNGWNGSGYGGGESQRFWDQLFASGLLATDITKIITDGDPYTAKVPKAQNDGSGVAVTAWNGKHYFRSGLSFFADGWGNSGIAVFSNTLSPQDAAYIFSKAGGTKITLGNSLGIAVPDGLLARDRILPVHNIIANMNSYNNQAYKFYNAVTQGAGGATSAVCIDNTLPQPYFNLKNPNKLCSLIIQADF